METRAVVELALAAIPLVVVAVEPAQIAATLGQIPSILRSDL